MGSLAGGNPGYWPRGVARQRTRWCIGDAGMVGPRKGHLAGQQFCASNAHDEKSGNNAEKGERMQ
jgi:hypothetical protein